MDGLRQAGPAQDTLYKYRPHDQTTFFFYKRLFCLAFIIILSCGSVVINFDIILNR